METPSEIIAIIEFDFPLEDFQETLEKVKELYSARLNVGNDQLVRALLFLSKGSKTKFFSYFPMADPRDVLLEMERSSADKTKYI